MIPFFTWKLKPWYLNGFLELIKTVPFKAEIKCKDFRTLAKQVSYLMLIDIEQKEKFDRVDDSVCAVRSALQEGIVSGGGLALYMATDKFKKDTVTENQKVALEILVDAIQVPLKQIIINSGKDPQQIIKLINFNDNTVGYDVKAEVVGDMS